MKKVNEREREIAERFFYCLEVLARRKVIRGLQTFTRANGLNYGNMCTLKNHRDRWSLKTEHLAMLAESYEVSCQWLLLGRGPMFTEKHELLFGKVDAPAPMQAVQ